jgi:hypothetical protein
MVISNWFMEGYKRRPEDRELDSYERGLDSYWTRINQQQGNYLVSHGGIEDAHSPGKKWNKPSIVSYLKRL